MSDELILPDSTGPDDAPDLDEAIGELGVSREKSLGDLGEEPEPMGEGDIYEEAPVDPSGTECGDYCGKQRPDERVDRLPNGVRRCHWCAVRANLQMIKQEYGGPAGQVFLQKARQEGVI